MAKIEIKLSANNVTFKTIKQFFLNNIDSLFLEYNSFTWSFIRTTADVVAINDSKPNFSSNCPTLINIWTNAVINSDLDNFSSKKESYLSNDCSFSSNNNHYKNNLNVGINSKSDISLIVLIKKCIWQE